MRKLIVAIVVVVCAVVVAWQFGGWLRLDTLAAHEAQLREAAQTSPWTSYALAFLLYVLVTGLSIPGATVLSLVYGWLFGFVPGVLLVSFASTAGATMAFLLSRYLLRDSVQSRFGERARLFQEKLQSEGPYYLLTLRLIPVVPFFIINAAMGLTPIKTATFWWVSQLGMLPATIVFLYAGSSVPTLVELAERGAGGILSGRILVALILIGLLPLFARWLAVRVRRKAQLNSQN